MPRQPIELTPEVMAERYAKRQLKMKEWTAKNKETQTIKLKAWYEANKERLNKRSTELRREKREANKKQEEEKKPIEA
jgi:hypothetical protein